MTLSEKQRVFMYYVGRLLVWFYDRYAAKGYGLRGAELYRTAEQAEIHAANGVGIVNSLHRKSLAIDVWLMRGDAIIWDDPIYTEIGEMWKSLHPLNRWGGDFRNRDAYHLSMEHGGVK